MESNYQKLKSQSSKLIAEFLLIVLGVTIALWLENIADDMKDQEIEHEYLLGFATDVRTDIVRLKYTIKNNQEIATKVNEFLTGLLENNIKQPEFTQKISTLMNYDYFSPDDFTLTSIRESGDFRLLRNNDIKLNILQLKRHYDGIEVLQKNFQNALDNQIVPMVIANVNLITDELINPEFINDFRLLNIVGYTLNDINARVNFYKQTLKKAESLQSLLNTNL